MKEGTQHSIHSHHLAYSKLAPGAFDPGHSITKTNFLEMKKLILKSSIACLSLMALGTVHAQTAQSARVEFAGNISAVTCTVNNNSRNQRINYGIVPPNATGFTGGGGAVGNVALPAFERPITIVLDGCSTPGGAAQHPSSARVRVTGPVNAEGRLSTSNATADIQLLEHGSTTDVWNLNQDSRNVPINAGTNTLRFISRYYVAALPLGGGAAEANAIFNMDYN